MKRSEIYKKLIKSLIDALNKISNEKPNERILLFGDYTRDEIFQTSYFIIKSELSRFSDLTEEDFAKMSFADDIQALSEILGSDLSQDIPANLNELVDVYNERPIGEPSAKAKTLKVDPQSPEQRVLRQINNIRTQQEAPSYVEPAEDIVVPVVTTTEKTRIDNFKERAKSPSFKDEIKNEIAAGNPNTKAPLINNAVDVFATALGATPTFFAVAATLSSNPGLIIPESQPRIQAKIKEIYQQRVEGYKSAKPILSKAFGQDVIEALIPDDSLTPKEFRVTKTPRSSESAIKINLVEISNATNLKPQEISDKVVEGFFSIPPSIKAIEITPIEATPVSGFWYSPVSRPAKSLLWAGAEKLAEENPEQATALAVAGRKISGNELGNLKLVALNSGISLQQWDLFEENIKNAKRLGWVEIAYATGISGIDNETANKLFQNGQFNFNAVSPSHILGGVPFNIGKNLVGNRVKGYIKNQVFKKAAEKVVSSAIGKAATAALSSLNAIAPGLGQAIAVIGGKIIGWLASKVYPWIRKHLGWIFGGLGALAGFTLFGAAGAIGGGLVGAVAAGAITTGTIGGTVGMITAALGALFAASLSAILVPLLVTLVGIPIAIVFILFIINSGAYIIPPGAGIGEGLTNVTGGAGVSFPVACTKVQLRLKFANTESSPVAKSGWDIVNNLYQGFWCDWNHSPAPDYPELFDNNLFAIDPNPPYPGPIQGYPNALFWCAWLVSKAYLRAGIPMVQTAGVLPQRDYFRAHGRIIPPNLASGNPSDPNYVPPGSAIFMSTSSFQWGHVGLVYSVNQDGFRFIQSDAGTKDGSFTFNPNGVGVQNAGVAGFGVLGQ